METSTTTTSPDGVPVNTMSPLEDNVMAATEYGVDGDEASYEEVIIEESDDEWIEEIITDEQCEYFISKSNLNFSMDDVSDDEGGEVDEWTEETIGSEDEGDAAYVVASDTGHEARQKQKGQEQQNTAPRNASNTSTSRVQIKTAAQKRAEEEAARRLAEEEEARALRELILIKKAELERLQLEAQRQREEEEAETARVIAERERLRQEKERKAAESVASEMAQRIADQKESGERQRLQEEEEQRRLLEEQQQKMAAAKAAAINEAAERARREAEEEARKKEEEERRRLIAEAKRLEEEMEKARLAVEAAKKKESEEKQKLKEKINARRLAAKERLAKASAAVKNKNEDEVPAMFAAAMNKPDKYAAPKTGIEDYKSVTTFYPAKDLRAKSIPGLDYKNREKYLSAQEFQDIFECTKEEFAAWPQWKKTQVKRKKGLF